MKELKLKGEKISRKEALKKTGKVLAATSMLLMLRSKSAPAQSVELKSGGSPTPPEPEFG